MTVDEARTHYLMIMAMLKQERKFRDKFLAEPRRGAALAEVNGAIDALEHLGLVMADAAKAGVLTSGHEQQPLIEVPETRKQYL